MKLDGTLTRRADGGQVVTFERTIDRPIARVWAALTDAAVLKNWLGDVEVEPRVGGKFVIRFRDMNEVMTGEITALEPERLLEFTWFEENSLPRSLVRWELREADGGCRLTLTHSFPPGLKTRDLVGFLGGWEAFLNIFPRGVDGEFVPYADQNEGAIAAGYRARYAADLAREENPTR